MSKAGPSKFAVAKTWVAVILAAVLLAWGLLRYGFSAQVGHDFWPSITDRLHGPMTFRFILQPTMAFIFALIDGINDARHGHKSFFWSAWGDPSLHKGRLREGLISIANVILLGISMDAMYQFKMFDRFYPVEALMMAILLAVLPYFAFRWIVERVARWWFARSSTGQAS